MKGLLALSLVVGVVAVAADSMLPTSITNGVIAAATVAYCGFTWRLVRSAEIDRGLRTAEADARKATHLEALLVELRHNVARSGKSHVWHAHIPFERSALDAARGYMFALPDPVAKALQEAELAISQYNGLAEYNLHQVAAGSGVADDTLGEHATHAANACAKADTQLELILGQLKMHC